MGLPLSVPAKRAWQVRGSRKELLLYRLRPLGGSGVVISGVIMVISLLIWVIRIDTLLITTHEPPSNRVF